MSPTVQKYSGNFTSVKISRLRYHAAQTFAGCFIFCVRQWNNVTASQLCTQHV